MQALAKYATRGTGGLIAALLFAGCLLDPVNGGADSGRPGRLTLEVATVAVPARAALVADLGMMTVLMASGRDTLVDTVTAQGSRISSEPAWLDGTGGYAHLFLRYELAAGRRWTVLVRTYDARDSVIHEERRDVDAMRPFEYRSLRVEMTPRRMQYAVHATLPARDSFGDSARYERAELVVDGITVRDTVIASTERTELVLAYPDMSPGPHTVQLRVYGAGAETSAPRLLLKGSASLLAGEQDASQEPASEMEWIGGDEALSGARVVFRIGAVGKVGLNVTVPSAVVL